MVNSSNVTWDFEALITVDQLYAAFNCENAEMFCFENPELSLDVEIKHRKS